MLFVVLIAVFLALLIGLALKFVLDILQPSSDTGDIHCITWVEFAVVAAVMALLVAPVTAYAGKKLSVANIVTYEQFLNGVETEAVDTVVKCRAGYAGINAAAGESNCSHSYDTGVSYPYTIDEPQDYPCTDGQGKPSTCSRMVPVTHWAQIYAPYATREHRYVIKSSFGFMENKPYQFAGAYLDSNPTPYGDRTIPSSVPKGAPKDWLDAKAHLDAGNPRPVTALGKYDNYILTGEDETLLTYSADISRYKKAKLLPDHTVGIRKNPIGGASASQAQKLSFVGVKVAKEKVWQEALMRFNAALGLKLQGDMHVVVVDAARVPRSSAVSYRNALKAYWQGPTFGKRALAKNAIIVVIGVSGNSSIEWAESTTGMPNGNELMAQYIRSSLPESEFSPHGLFGEPRTTLKGKKAAVSLSSPRGILEKIVFEDAPFARASMSCEDENETCVGFADMLDTIEPTTGQKVVIVLVSSTIALLLWLLVGFTSLAGRGISSARRSAVRISSTPRFTNWK